MNTYHIMITIQCIKIAILDAKLAQFHHSIMYELCLQTIESFLSRRHVVTELTEGETSC
jgi:hypothetical protein